MNWVEIKEIEDYKENYEWAEFVYITAEGYSDTAIGVASIPDPATHFIVLPQHPELIEFATD